jgi:hypothetical protein
LGLVLIQGTGCSSSDAGSPLVLADSILIPTPGGSALTYDVGFWDPQTQLYFLADGTNGSIDIIDGKKPNLVGSITGFSHPRGLAASGTRVFVGDELSTVRVADLVTRSIVGAISTGGAGPVDGVCYSPQKKLVMAANKRDFPPFLSLISTETSTVVATIKFSNAFGIEFCAWDPSSGRFYVAVTATSVNPGGEIDAIDPSSMAVTHVYPLPGTCGPTGVALGPSDELLVMCGELPAQSLIIHTLDGRMAATFDQIGGGDEVCYDPESGRYYLTAAGMTSDGSPSALVTPVLGVIDAVSHTWMANVAMTAGIKSVAVDSATQRIFIPDKASASVFVLEPRGTHGP